MISTKNGKALKRCRELVRHAIWHAKQAEPIKECVSWPVMRPSAPTLPMRLSSAACRGNNGDLQIALPDSASCEVDIDSGDTGDSSHVWPAMPCEDKSVDMPAGNLPIQLGCESELMVDSPKVVRPQESADTRPGHGLDGLDCPSAYMAQDSPSSESGRASQPVYTNFFAQLLPPTSEVQTQCDRHTTKSSFLSRRGAVNRARFSEDVDWLLFDAEDPEQDPVTVRKPMRPDGYTRKLQPGSVLHHHLDLSATGLSWEEQLARTLEEAPPGSVGQAHLLRCRSFEFHEHIVDLPSQGEGLTLAPFRSTSPFSCKCSSVSTSDEWKQALYTN